MIDGISGNNGNNINELHADQLSQNQQVNAAGKDARNAQKADNVLPLFGDQADISEAAKSRLEAEKEVMKFSSLAQRMDEPFDSDKVSYFKDMLDSGRINDYLKGLNNGDLADSILGSAAGAFLR